MDLIEVQYPIGQLLINFDPPYVKKGQELYLNHFSLEDHTRLYQRIEQSSHHWIVTYDYHDFIVDLYSAYKHELLSVNHSAGGMKIGQELIIYSHSLSNASSRAETGVEV